MGPVLTSETKQLFYDSIDCFIIGEGVITQTHWVNVLNQHLINSTFLMSGFVQLESFGKKNIGKSKFS